MFKGFDQRHCIVNIVLVVREDALNEPFLLHFGHLMIGFIWSLNDLNVKGMKH